MKCTEYNYCTMEWNDYQHRITTILKNWVQVLLLNSHEKQLSDINLVISLNNFGANGSVESR